MEIDQTSQELTKRRLEEDQQRAHEAKQSAWEIAGKEEQRVREIEVMKRRRACEALDADKKRAFEDMDMAAYTKNIKIKQMRERVQLDACMMKENDYQECCREELEISQLDQE